MNMMPLTAALIIPNRTLWEQSHTCIQNLPVRIAVEQNQPGEADTLLDRIERHRVDVVMIEANCLSLPLEEFIRRLRTFPAQPAVFVLHTEASPQLILEALRAGATEYLYTPLAEPLRTALVKLSAARSRQGGTGSTAPGKIFGFLSARGGAGATTFAIHVATDLARTLKQPILLADFDFEAGLLRFLTKSKSVYSVRNALKNMHRMDISYWKALISTHAHQMDFIAAPDDLAAKLPPRENEIAQLLRFIRSIYPLTIVDFGRHASSTAFDALAELETLYLIADLDLTTLDYARLAIAQLEERGLPSDRLKLLLNQVPDRRIPDPQGIEDYVGRPCAAAFTKDYMALYDAYSEGRLLDAAADLGKDFRELAESVAQIKVNGPGPASTSGRSRLQPGEGFFQRTSRTKWPQLNQDLVTNRKKPDGLRAFRTAIARASSIRN